MQTASQTADGYSFSTTRLMTVTSKDGQRAVAMPINTDTFAHVFHGRFLMANGAVGDVSILDDASGLDWLMAERQIARDQGTSRGANPLKLSRRAKAHVARVMQPMSVAA